MKKVIFIVLYFGQFPSMFDIWLKTASFNKDYTFRIYTDNKKDRPFPNNVELIETEFDDMKRLIQSKFDFEICLDQPYKLCDYKITYGYIFEDSIQDYDFWGYCDLDILLGNLHYFITEKEFFYDKIFVHGHMTLMKNTYENNRSFMIPVEGKESYRDILCSKKNWAFDENSDYLNINLIYQSMNKKYYYDYNFLDFIPMHYLFRRRFYDYGLPYVTGIKRRYENIKKQILLWDKGTLRRFYLADGNKVVNEEFRYVHLQKRDMRGGIPRECDRFLIVPNKFIPFDGEVTNKVIKQYTCKPLIYTPYFRLRYNNMKEKVRRIWMKGRVNE